MSAKRHPQEFIIHGQDETRPIRPAEVWEVTSWITPEQAEKLPPFRCPPPPMNADGESVN